jgi:hypothetical protein
MSFTAHWKSIGAKCRNWWGLHIQEAAWGQPERRVDHSLQVYELISFAQNGFVPLNVFLLTILSPRAHVFCRRVYIGEKHSEGKDVGEKWAAVNKTINSILWTSVASNRCPPEWGQSRSHYMARRGPCRTYSRDASRRPKHKYVHSQYMRVVFDAIYNHVMYVLAMTNTHFPYNNRCLFFAG